MMVTALTMLAPRAVPAAERLEQRTSKRAAVSSLLGAFLNLFAEQLTHQVAVGLATECAHTLAHETGERLHALVFDLRLVSLDDFDDGLADLVLVGTAESGIFGCRLGRLIWLLGQHRQQVRHALVWQVAVVDHLEDVLDVLAGKRLDGNVVATEFGQRRLERRRGQRWIDTISNYVFE